MNTTQTKALQFWHDRVGSLLGDADWKTSLSSAYPCVTKNGVRGNRIGSLAPAAVLIDAQSAVVIERLSVEHLPERHRGHVQVISPFDSAAYSLTKTVFEWACSQDRVFPLLALMPTKRSLLQDIRLSETPSSVSLIEPGHVVSFNLEQVLRMRASLMQLDKPVMWRRAVEIREAVETMPSNVDAFERKRLFDQYQKVAQDIPRDLELPRLNTPLYEALAALMIQKDAMPIGGKN
jgi:hypothetical protein